MRISKLFLVVFASLVPVLVLSAASPAQSFKDIYNPTGTGSPGYPELTTSHLPDLPRPSRFSDSGSIFRDPASQFVVPAEYLATQVIYSAVIADFNGDGMPDIAAVCACKQGSAIEVLLNAGNGLFTQSSSGLPVNEAYSVYAADVNGDGRIDLITADYYAGTISVLIGNGSGGFSPLVSYSVPGKFPFQIVIGDFNGDGHVDLLVRGGASVPLYSLFPGNGDGTFGPPQKPGIVAGLGQMAAADFNRDGKLDVAIANLYTSNNVSIFLGNGDGTFQKPILAATGTEPVALAVADFNKDGIPDLAVADQGVLYSQYGDVAILLGKGDGTFQPAVFYSDGYNFPNGIVAGDFNGDGNPDIGVLDSYNVRIVPGNGDGTLSSATAWYSLVAKFLVAGDLNGDNKTDLTVGGLFSGIATFLSNRSTVFDAPVIYQSNSVLNLLAAGDFNNDGKIDLAGTASGSNGTDGSIIIFPGNGDGTFQTTGNFTIDSGGQVPWTILATDLNRDGKLDLLVSNASGIISGNVSVFLGNGDGTFTPAGSYGTGSYGLIAIGDFNGDGLTDVASIRASYVDILLGNGDGTFRPPISYNIGQSGYNVAVADFNRDGKLDLVISTRPGYQIALGNGDGTFQTGVNYSLPYAVSLIFVADFNNDGIPDIGIAAVNDTCSAGYTGYVGYQLGNGDGTFQPPRTRASPVACPGYSAGVGDLNGDGIVDFLELDNGPGVVLFLGNPSGLGAGLEAGEFYTVGSGAAPPVLADFNGDGATDVAIVSWGGFSVLMNTSGVNEALASSENPSIVGQAVKFTARVSASFPSAGTPAGSVIFRDGSHILGTVALSSGLASLTTSILTVGNHAITAAYSGDGTFVPKKSKTLIQIVKQ